MTVSVPLLIVIRNWQPLFMSTGGHCVNIGGAMLTLAVKKSSVPGEGPQAVPPLPPVRVTVPS